MSQPRRSAPSSYALPDAVKVYAHAVDGQGPAAMKRIEDALNDEK
ncbi:hypothetical protein GCM10010197_25630 [Nocardioides luteus]|uniref:Uncharacterized protein n=1 Tax=Nocardioides luteus TaxID=1844 RepID=A0ABQ5SX38_9ACTN|nr:hypothetical protein GCM10010197_25630 [Nocardioides luteus]GLJ68585.1 hypothetical protein GCM10017579_26210 [Nocardioides luteus]